MMYRILYLMFIFQSALTLFDNEINLECSGTTFPNVTLTTYYPDFENDGEYKDINGHQLRTLQDFIDDRNEYVTLSMDSELHIPYGTSVCIPELNRHLGHRIRVEVRDSSSDILGSGYKRAEICVRSEADSYDINYNRYVTLVFD